MAESLAIRSQLKRHQAKICTYADGVVASAAVNIFMAGDERVMANASLLFIHNAWTYGSGDANAFRKQAEDLDKYIRTNFLILLPVNNWKHLFPDNPMM